MQSGRNLDNKERQNKKRGLDRLKELDLIKKIIDLEK